mgnify:CR=1 FL=1
MTEKWGPWIPYTGAGFLAGVELGMICQIKGTIAGILFVSDPQLVSHPAMFSDIILADDEELIAHRIRKPRALQELINLAQDVPEKVDA